MGTSGTVTVLFTDLVGSTAMAARLGDEAADGVRRAHFAALRDAIAAHRGEVVKTLGDGFMVTFASVLDAAEASVAMQRAVVRLRAGRDPLAIRVGISVGEATAEDDGDWFGTPVVEAARLCALADGGQILASSLVPALMGSRGNLSFVDAGVRELKGLPAPVATVELEWARPAGGVIALPPSMAAVEQFAFVGRDDELDVLARAWKAALGGERRVVLITGEPGIGKTRLAAELARTAYAEGAVVLAGRCDQDLGVPFQPFVEALRHQAASIAGDGDSRERLGRHAGELVRLLPSLGDAVPDLPAPLASDPETEQFRLFDAVAEWLTATAADTGLLLLLDDLHWAAKPTLLLLRHVVRSAQARLLVVGTYRDTELARTHPLTETLADLRRDAGVERVALRGLDARAVEAFLAAAAGHELDDRGRALAGAIHHETEGNAFFVGEVVRHLAESGAVYQRDGRWVSDLDPSDMGIPEGVREVVGRRLSSLSDTTNGVLTAAAVVGAEFDAPTLAAAAGLPADTVLQALEEAADARVIDELAGPKLRFRFSHALVRGTLYDELSLVRRVRLHRDVGEAIERLHGADLEDHLPDLAHHFAQAAAAGDATKAVEYARRAGDRALAALAHDQAVDHFRRALELLGPAGDDRGRAELLLKLGEGQRRAGDAGHRDTLLECSRLAQRVGDAALLAAAALANHRGFWSAAGEVDAERVGAVQAALDAVGDDEPGTRARLLGILAQELSFGSALSRRIELAREALALARQTGDDATLGEVLVAAYMSTWHARTHDARMALAAEIAELAPRLPAGIAKPWGWLIPAMAAAERADFAAAEVYFAAADDVVEAMGAQLSMQWASMYLDAGRVLAAGRIDDAERRATEALDVGVAAGQPDAMMFFSNQLFAVRREQRRLGELVDVLEQLAADHPKLPAWRTCLLLAYAQGGRLAEAKSLLDELAASDFDLPDDLLWLSGQTFCAEAAIELGDATAARRLYATLLPYRHHMSGNALVWIGPVEYFLGCLAFVAGDVERAREHLDAAADTSARIGASVWLAQARAWQARVAETPV